VNTHPDTALNILQLLLRCGMVCREELNVVLEMMPAIPDSRTVAMNQLGDATPQHRQAPQPQSQQNRLSSIDNNRARG
jgi:hypothetical protein